MKSSNKLFVICTVFVPILLISLNYSVIHDFYVYSVPLNDFVIYRDDSLDHSAKFLEVSEQKDSGCITIKANYFCYKKPRMFENDKGGVSYLFSNTTKINGELHFDKVNGGEFYFTMTNMTRTNDGAIITFQDKDYSVGGNGKIIYEITDKFEYTTSIKKFDTFIAKCDNDKGTSVTLVQYLGIATIDDEDYFMTWHTNADSDAGIPCNYPQVIQYSIGHDFGDI